MRFAALIVALAASVVAQDLGQLPSCATGCVGNSLASTGCGQLNVTCICNSAGWIADLTCCIASGCNDADKAATIKFAQNICQPVGVTLPSAAVCSSSTSATATGASNSTTKTATSTSVTSASKTSSTAAAASSGAAAPTGQMLGFGAGIAGIAGLLAAAL